MQYYNFYFRSDLIEDISKAINGEYSAIHCYEQLASQALNPEVKNQILEIRKDEIGHYQVFSQIYTTLTGSQPNPKITEKCPSDYHRGLEAAFRDEQETVDFYLEIADKADDLFIREQFRRAAADEQNHAVWFLYFMNR